MAGADSFEGFAAAARALVEAEAGAHADDLWWVLAPTLLVARPGGRVDPVPLTRGLATRPLGRAIIAADVAALLDALGARRCAVAVHADLEVDGDIFAAILLAVLGRMTSSYQYARVERTDFGTPRLAPWQPGALAEVELFSGLRRAITDSVG